MISAEDENSVCLYGNQVTDSAQDTAESAGELLTGADYFPFAEAEGSVVTLVVNSRLATDVAVRMLP